MKTHALRIGNDPSRSSYKQVQTGMNISLDFILVVQSKMIPIFFAVCQVAEI